MLTNPTVYIKSSEQMQEVKSNSVKLLLGASVYLGADQDWTAYENLYQQIYVHEGGRVLRKDGALVVIQTNAYENGRFTCRYWHLVNMFMKWKWSVVDERVWERRAADHFQVPFSHVLVMRPPGGTVKRTEFNKRSKDWFRGIWRYKQTHGGELNSYPPDFCRMLVEACTDKGDLIVDPFAGTGVLLDVAASMDRLACGYEINEDLIPTLRANGCVVCQNGVMFSPTKKGFVF